MSKWDCSCWVNYPNKAHRKRNGEWKCVDSYECIRDRKGYDGKTHCRRKNEEAQIFTQNRP